MPLMATCASHQPTATIGRSSPPIRAVRLAPSSTSTMSASHSHSHSHSLSQPLARPLVRSAGCAQLQGESVQPHFYQRVYNSDEDDSGDECSLRGRVSESSVSSHLPSYVSVYSNIRQAATVEAQRVRDRQLEMTHISALWEQHKRDGPNGEVSVASTTATKRPSVSPAIRSTLSTASESSQLSSYSSDGGSGCDTDSDREAGRRADLQRSGKQQPRTAAQPQHFTFSVDDIDRALTEEELDDWFHSDETSQRAHDTDDVEDDDDRSDDEDEQPHKRATLFTHVAVRSPLVISTAASSLSSLSPSTTPIKANRPRLTVDTASTDYSVDSESDSTIAVLPATVAVSASSLSSSAAAAGPIRRFKRTSLPCTFTFSRCDIRKSADTVSEELNVGVWTSFPRPSVPVCDVRALRGRLREKIQQWDRQAWKEQLAAEQQQLNRPCSVDEKRESIRKPAAARRLFVDSSSGGAVRARQSVVMWRRDSQTAQVAPLPQALPLPLPVPSPPNDRRAAHAAAQPIMQHRRAATAYSHARIAQAAAQRRTHFQYDPASLVHLHAQQQQQQQQLQRQHIIHAAHASQPHPPPQPHHPHTRLHHHQPSSAHSDPSSLASSPGTRATYSRMTYSAHPTSYPLLAYQINPQPASGLFSPRTANKHHQPCQPHQQQLASYALQHSLHPTLFHTTQQHGNSYQPQHYTAADYFNHYSHYQHDTLHPIKPTAHSSHNLSHSNSHSLSHSHSNSHSHEVWLTQQANCSQHTAGHTLERCVSAVGPTSCAHTATSHVSQQHSLHQQRYHRQQQQLADWPSNVSLPTAAHHSRVVSAPPQRCRQ